MTEQEARDAFVKPVDPTPLTFDEICGIVKLDDFSKVFMPFSVTSILHCFGSPPNFKTLFVTEPTING